jgi:hypothetical protein
MTIYIDEIRAFTSPSGTQIPASGWTNDCSPFLQITEPSGTFLRGYSISIIEPGDDETYVPDYDEITDTPGGAWIFGGYDFIWDDEDVTGWDGGRWEGGFNRQNWWDVAASGVPPIGIPPS